MTARDDARNAWQLKPAFAVKQRVERCANVYGVAPCTASGAAGSECYNTRPTCQDLANFSSTEVDLKMCERGMRIPPGEMYFPYIERVHTQPSKLDPEGGLSNRANVRLTLVDEVIPDRWQDPYVDNRGTVAGSTFWTRFMARNKALPGRMVELLRGYDVAPWDWNVFITELYSIDTLEGPDRNGKMQLVIKDPVKLLDNVELPRPTNGKLLVELPQYDDIGVAAGGSANTIVLHADAEPIDDFYNGMAVKIYDATGAGQERTITDYDGVSRTATVSSNWSVNPDATSFYFVQQLSITLDAHGADYIIYGVPGYIRVGKEIIKFSARVGDVISWPDTGYRSQFNTPLEDHREGATVQVCKAFANMAYTDVIKWFYTESGLDAAYIDSAGFAALDTTWLANDCIIDGVALSTPRKASVYVKELLNTIGAMTWWDAQSQKVKFALMVPQPPGVTIPVLTDEAELVDRSTEIETLNAVRLTLSALYFNLQTATSNIREANNYLDGAVYHDQDALDEYGVEQTQVQYSQFFKQANARAARDAVARAMVNRRDPPLLIKCEVHPKDYDFQRGDYRDFYTDKIVDEAGQPRLTRAMITMVDDQGETIKVEARSSIFARRFAFFAPNGTANYPNNNGYACFCNDNGLMPDGTEGYMFY